MWMIIKFVMDYFRLEELVSLHYWSFAALSEWAKVLAQGTGCSKWPTEHAQSWQLFLNEQSKDHPDMNVAHCQEWGLFLLECLLHNVVTMRKREIQWQLHRCPHSNQSVTAKETAPVHLSVRSLRGSANEKIPNLAEDVYCRQYQVVPSFLSPNARTSWWGTTIGCWANRWWRLASMSLLAETGPYPGAECASGLARSLRLGHPWWRPAGRKEGTFAPPQQHGCNCTWANWSSSADFMRNWEHPHASSSDEGCHEATHAKWWEPVGPSLDIILHWTQSHTNMSESRQTLGRWTNPLTGGQNSNPFTGGAQENLAGPRCRN